MPMQQQFQRNPNCPPGLEYLTAIDQLLVHQKVELLEGIIFCLLSNLINNSI